MEKALNLFNKKKFTVIAKNEERIVLRNEENKQIKPLKLSSFEANYILIDKDEDNE